MPLLRHQLIEVARRDQYRDHVSTRGAELQHAAYARIGSAVEFRFQDVHVVLDVSQAGLAIYPYPMGETTALAIWLPNEPPSIQHAGVPGQRRTIVRLAGAGQRVHLERLNREQAAKIVDDLTANGWRVDRMWS